MNDQSSAIRQAIAAALTVMLLAPFGAASTVPRTEGASKAVNSGMNGPAPATGSVNATRAYASLPDNPQAAATQQSTQSQSSSSTSTSPPQQQTGSAPVGTAAAPYEKPVGVPASRPAGAAIAPAKQRRVRALLIKVGVVIGAAVAVGTVIGLSKASSSRP